MQRNGWKRYVLIIGMVVAGRLESQAQYEQMNLSELDRLPAWYAFRSTGAPGLTFNYPQPYSYTNVGELVQKASTGSKVEALILSNDALTSGGLAGLGQLKQVRVLTLNGLTTGGVDSVLRAVQDWPLLERLSINSNPFPAGGRLAMGSVILSAGLQRFPKLHDLRLSDHRIDWNASMPTLSGMKSLRELTLNHQQGASTPLPDLSRLSLLKVLRLSGRGWIMKAGAFDGLTQLTDLTLANASPDTTMLETLLGRLTRLETLTVENCQPLKTLKAGPASALTSLVLSYNADLAIDAHTLAGLPKLERLVIRQAASVDLSGMCSLPNLRVLVVNGARKPVQLPACLDQLGQLTELRLESPVAQVPAGIGSLTKLQKLSLMNAGIDSLPFSLAQLTALQELALSNNKLRQLPGFGQLKALKQLSASNNQLTNLPDELGQLTQLTLLTLDQNKLSQLPASLTRLTALKTLSLANNQLTNLPEDLGKLTKLQFLTIGSNKLTQLPGTLGQMDSLRSLSVGRNQLRTLPAGLTKLRNLTNLSVGANEITALPADMGALRQLVSLWLDAIPITELPPSFTELTNLQTLYINNTRLRLLPDDLGKLTKLQRVSLSNNELIALPNSIGNWQAMTSLELYQNRLEGLPAGIGRLTKLAYLNIGGKLDAPTGGLEQLPDSLVQCVNLRNLTIQNQPQLDADDLLRKAARMPGLSNLTIQNCNVSHLPELTWRDVSWQSLNLSENLLTELPVGLLDAPKLQNLAVQQNKLPEAFNQGYFDKEGLRVAFAEAGTLSLETLRKPNAKVASAYNRMAARKASRREWGEALTDFQKAIDFTPDTTLAIAYAQRAEFHFFRKAYADALADFEKAIAYAPQLRKQPFADSLSVNRSLATFWQRKSAVLGALGQYDDALSGLDQAARFVPARNSEQQTGLILTERGRYLTLKNKLTEADSSYAGAIRSYEKLPNAEPGIRLTIVELSLLTGQYDRARLALLNTPPDQMRGGYAVLKEYLDTCLSVLNSTQTGVQATDRFSVYLAKHSDRIYGWSFDLFDNWLAKGTLAADKAAALRQLTEAAKAQLVRPE